MPGPLRTLRALLACTSLVFSGAACADLFTERATDLQQESRRATRQGKQLAVLFEQEGCEACATMRRQAFSDRAAAREFEKSYRTLRVDIGRGDALSTPDGQPTAARAWAERLRIPGTPAIAFFDGGGKLRYRHVGPLANGTELRLLGRYIAAGEYERRPFVSYLSARKLGVKRVNNAINNVPGALCHTRSS